MRVDAVKWRLSDGRYASIELHDDSERPVQDLHLLEPPASPGSRPTTAKKSGDQRKRACCNGPILRETVFRYYGYPWHQRVWFTTPPAQTRHRVCNRRTKQCRMMTLPHKWKRVGRLPFWITVDEPGCGCWVKPRAIWLGIIRGLKA